MESINLDNRKLPLPQNLERLAILYVNGSSKLGKVTAIEQKGLDNFVSANFGHHETITVKLGITSPRERAELYYAFPDIEGELYPVYAAWEAAQRGPFHLRKDFIESDPNLTREMQKLPLVPKARFAEIFQRVFNILYLP